MLIIIMCETKNIPLNSSKNLKFRASKASPESREGIAGKAFFTWTNKQCLDTLLGSFRGDDR